MCPGGLSAQPIPGTTSSVCADGTVLDIFGNPVAGTGATTNQSTSSRGSGWLDLLKDALANVDDIILATKGGGTQPTTTVINQAPANTGSKVPVWAVGLISFLSLGFLVALFAALRKKKK